MAVEYNTEGSTDANAWSGSGFAANATLVAANPGGPWTTNLDQSANDITYLQVLSAFREDIGNAANPLQVEADAIGLDSYIRYRPGGGSMWLKAEDATGPATINNLDVGGSGRAVLVGGTFTNVTQDGGHIHANQTTIGTNFYAFGGTSRWEAQATPITLARCIAGKHIFERTITTLDVSVGSEVVIDDPGGSITTINMYGGTLIYKAGDAATVNGTRASLIVAKPSGRSRLAQPRSFRAACEL